MRFMKKIGRPGSVVDLLTIKQNMNFVSFVHKAGNTLRFIETSKVEVHAGCSQIFLNFEAELFLICS